MIETDWIARHLIEALPYAWFIKGVVFIVLGGMLLSQQADTLGKWVNGLFVATILTGFWATWLTSYLTRDLQAHEIDSPALWGLLITGHLAPWAVNVTGIGVAYYTYRTTPLESQLEREKRQQHTQEILDETSWINAVRGKKISEKGLELDDRIIRLASDQRVHDAEGVRQDEEHVRQDAVDIQQDQREVEQNRRDKESHDAESL